MPIDVTEEFKRDVLGVAEAPGSAGAEPKSSAVAEEFRRETHSSWAHEARSRILDRSGDRPFDWASKVTQRVLSALKAMKRHGFRETVRP